MTDILSASRRSILMRRVRQKGTSPELKVRRLVRQLGFRYRANGKGLPGSPDIVFRSIKKAIFVHGCFWHAHQKCKKWKIPDANEEYWKDKFFHNVVRDKRKVEELHRLGYDVLVIWECEVSKDQGLDEKIKNFLSNDHSKERRIGHATLSYSRSLDNCRVLRDTFVGETKVATRRLYVPLSEQSPDSQVSRDLFDWAFLRSAERPNFSSGGREVRVADLFAGCGGLSLGAAEACQALALSFKSVFALDSDQASLNVYKANFSPERAECLDIVKIIDGEIGQPATANERELVVYLGEIDLLLAGPPCQGHSDLNNHTRREDKRNGLYDRVTRFAELARPRHILIENVPTIVHATNCVVQRANETLKTLGYATDEDTIDLSKLGIPQRRRRHVLIASREMEPRVRDIMDRHSVNGVRTLGWAIRDLEGVLL